MGVPLLSQWSALLPHKAKISFSLTRTQSKKKKDKERTHADRSVSGFVSKVCAESRDEAASIKSRPKTCSWASVSARHFDKSRGTV